MKTHVLWRHRQQLTAVVVLALFSWFSIAPWNYAAADQQPSRLPPPSGQLSRTSRENYAQVLLAMMQEITKLSSQAQAIQALDIATSLANLQGHQQALARAEAQLLENFHVVEATLTGSAALPPVILQRHRKMVETFKAESEALHDTMDMVLQLAQERSSTLLQQKLEELHALLRARLPERPHVLLDPDHLPYRTPEVQMLPALEEERTNQAVGDSLSSQHSRPPKAPSPEDLEETPDVRFTPGLRELAADIGHNPLTIFNWVFRNIVFVPTFGSIQGSEGCRLSKECNAHDTASLLIALLRNAGIPARYVIGTVEMNVNIFKSVMGDFQDLNAAIRLAAGGGIPLTVRRDASGAIRAVQMKHVWVEVAIKPVPHARAKPAVWVPLEPAFKRTHFHAPLDIQQALGLDLTSELETLIATGTPTANAITGISESLTIEQITEITSALETYIDQSLPEDVTVRGILGDLEIQQRQIPVLALLLRKVLAVEEHVAELPSSSRHHVTLRVTDVSGTVVAITLGLSLPELADRRLTLGYVPATEADMQTIETFGGLYNTPPYLVQLTPVVYREGEALAVGTPITMGLFQGVQLVFHEPDGRSDSVQHFVTVGTFAVIGLDLQRASSAALQARQARLAATLAQIGVTDIRWDDVIGEFLHVQAQGYFAIEDAYERVAAHQMNIRAVKRPVEMLMAFSPSFLYSSAVPIALRNVSMRMDLRRNIFSLASRTGETVNEKAYLITVGTFGSSLEHGIFEIFHNTSSVSTIKLLREANNRQNRIFGIDQTNVEEVLPELAVEPFIMNDVRNAVARGMSVFIPQENISVLDWTGIGYIVLDPTTGAGAYLLSGELAGGETAEESPITAQFVDAANELAQEGLAFILENQESIRWAAKITGPLNIASNLVDSTATAVEVYEETNNPWKTLGAGLAAFYINALAGAAIGGFVAAGIVGGAAGGPVGAVVAVPVIVVTAIGLIYTTSVIKDAVVEIIEGSP